MKNSKGITLASLVVMIASIILLSGMAIGFGYRYLTKTKEADETYFREVLSSAISKRENNHTVNGVEYPRIGYKVKAKENFTEIINKYIPDLKNINSELLYERGEWYIIDTTTAEKLGVKGSEGYIDVYDEESNEKMTVALTDYYSGAVYIFDMNGTELKDNVSGDIEKPDDGHEHDFNVPAATCTEDMKCLICGYVKEVALGHEYGGELSATPIDDEFHYKKECIRCGAKGGYERHKDLDEYAPHTSEDGTWYHYNGCSVCGWPTDNRNYEECSIVWKSISDTQHIKYCSICERQETFEHEETFKWTYIDENYHEEVCTVCGFVRVKFEPHEDNDNDNFCDKCNCEIIKDEKPKLVNVELRNKEYPESKFVTDRETIQLIFTADKMITDANVTICGRGGEDIKYSYSNNRLTCTAELYIDEEFKLAQNTNVTFTINCKSVTTGESLASPITQTTSPDSYLIYDSIPPLVEYINKDSY